MPGYAEVSKFTRKCACKSLIHLIGVRLRRGFQVYKEVCQACHSMKYLYWRMHVDVTHTKEEVKEMAAEVSHLNNRTAKS